MTSRHPVIKFSPFEALLIGEKNKILKRQPMKNTIFVTILNQQHKTINLRDLFDLNEKTKKPDNKDVVFKMPQRVREFLQTRRLKNLVNNGNVKRQNNVLCYEFEGQKMIVTNKASVKLKENNLNSVKPKRKLTHLDKIAKKFPVHAQKSHQTRNSTVSKHTYNSNKNQILCNNRVFLNGKNSKCFCDEKRIIKGVSLRKKYLSNNLYKFRLQKYIQKRKKIKTCNDKISKEDADKHIFNCDFDLNSLSKKFWINSVCRQFKFPKIIQPIDTSYFEDNCYLNDIIYEDFPKEIKFECNETTDDFSDSLDKAGIIKKEKELKIYGKKKNGFSGKSEVMVVFNGHVPFIKLRRLECRANRYFPVTNSRNGYSSSIDEIDEPYTKNNQLLNGKSIGKLFFRSVEGKDIFIGSVVKPFLHNSSFGSLSEF